MKNLFGESLPGHVLPVRWHILGAGIVCEVRLVNQIAATFPDQSGTLPRMVLRQKCKQCGRPRRIITGKKLFRSLRAFQELVLQR